jgi:hypothetical protein
MESIPPTPIPGRAPAAVAAGKSFYQRWQERWDEIAALMGRDVPVEMEQVQWLVGTWSTGITSYATPTRPERTNEHPEARFRWSSAFGGHWLLFEGEYRPANRFLFSYVRYLAYDPCSRQWVKMTIEHPAGWSVTTAPGWIGNQLIFEGTAQILGELVELRHRLVKLSDDAWKWESDEKQADGAWLPIDEHRYTRVVEDGTVPDV